MPASGDRDDGARKPHQAASASCRDRNGEPVKDVDRAFRAVARSAGLPWATPHVTPLVTRHTAATWLMQLGTPKWEAAECGWSKRVTVTRASDRYVLLRCYSTAWPRVTLRAFLKSSFLVQPPGYKEALNFLVASPYRDGRHSLQSQVLDGTLPPSTPAAHWAIAPNVITALMDISDDIYVVVPVGARPIFRPTSIDPGETISSHELVKALTKHHGYRQVTGGRVHTSSLPNPAPPTSTFQVLAAINRASAGSDFLRSLVRTVSISVARRICLGLSGIYGGVALILLRLACRLSEAQAHCAFPTGLCESRPLRKLLDTLPRPHDDVSNPE